MKKIIILIMFAFFVISPKLFAKGGFIFGGNIGFLGNTKIENISVKYDDTSDVSGVDRTNLEFGNELGFKLQAGFKYEFNEKIGLLSLFGYYDRTSEKVAGNRVQIDIFDASIQVQMHIWEGLYARLGINVPMYGKVTLYMDDKAKEALQGGQIDAKSVIGYDALLTYELMDEFMATAGFTMSNHLAEKERLTGGSTEYTVKFDTTNYQFFVGFDYTLPLKFLN